jgi:hypothetical protein
MRLLHRRANYSEQRAEDSGQQAVGSVQLKAKRKKMFELSR